MVCRPLAGILFSLTAGDAIAQSSATPANTLQELSAQLDHCLVTPKGAAGSQITIVFSLKRDGSVLGKTADIVLKASGP